MIYCYSDFAGPADHQQSADDVGRSQAATRIEAPSEMSMPDRDNFATRSVMSKALSTLLGVLASCRSRGNNG